MRVIPLLLCLCFSAAGEKSFKKNSGLDTKFPPDVAPTPSNVPVGHLRPLGWQRPPEGEVDDVDAPLTPQKFYSDWGARGTPLTIRGAAKPAPAASLWTDAYLRSKFGHVEVSVMVLREDKAPLYKLMPLSRFLGAYETEPWAVQTPLPLTMMPQLTLPQCIQCGTFARYLTQTGLWLSSGSTPSRLHWHAEEHLHCLLDGRKDLLLIDKRYMDALGLKDKAHSGEGESDMDTEMVNLFKYKSLVDIPWTYTILKPGDCLYIPSAYLHQVRSYGRSLSYVIKWSANLSPSSDPVTFNDCDSWTLSDDVTLGGTSFMWTHHNGHTYLTNKALNAETLRHHLYALLRQSDVIYYKQFKHFYNKVMAKMKSKPKCRDIFRHLDPNKTGMLTRDEIRKLDAKVLNTVAKVLNSAHPQYRVKDEL